MGQRQRQRRPLIVHDLFEGAEGAAAVLVRVELGEDLWECGKEDQAEFSVEESGFKA